MAAVVGSRRMRRLRAGLVYAALIALAVIFLFPLLWVLGLSLKTRLQVFADPPLFIWWPTLENYIDVLSPPNTTMKLDGDPIMGTTEPIGANWTVTRVHLGAGKNGSHELEASAPVGLQVMGFGRATSYCYPGGLDLKLISIPPDIH